MKVLHSIRWRLQFLYALLLALVLAGFGATAWRLDRATRLQRVDQDLERRVGAIVNSLRRDGNRPEGDRPRPERGQEPPAAQDRPPRDRPPEDRAPGNQPRENRPPPDGTGANRPPADQPPPPPGDLRLPEREAAYFDATGRTPYYYLVWGPDGREAARSAAAPFDVPPPDAGMRDRDARSRGPLREFVHRAPEGETIVVGRDIGDEESAMHRLGWLLLAVGGSVFAAALVGGWWVSGSALRPIKDISATAARISNGDLSQRIPITGEGSELAQLACVLNDTFARLEASFERQVRFTADASHELRTPVSVVLTQTQSALARPRAAEEYRHALGACQRAGKRMQRLIESLLTLARLDAERADIVRAGRCDFDVIVRDTVDLLQPLAQEHEVTVALRCSPTACVGDAGQLGQVVTNLVTNAICYNRPGGSVDVSCGVEANRAVLRVTDTGVGILPEDLAHVFERFYRADQSRTSNGGGRAGLGLAITKAIVDAHNGKIDVTSESGRGTTFTVFLPQSDVRHPPQ